MTYETVQIGSLNCKNLHPTFGAEVSGIDFSKPLSPTQVQDVASAIDRYGVIIFRDTGLDDKRHVDFSRNFGDLEKVPKFRGPNVPDRFDYPELFDAGNTDLEGRIVQKDSRRWWYNKGNSLWHVDSSFNQHRSKYSILLSHSIPTHGGNTDFADSRHAYRDLPEEVKNELKDLVAEHDLWHSRRLAAPEVYKTATEHERAAKQPAYHKLVQKAPDGGDTFYIATHASRIIGKPDAEGLDLINKMIDHCIQPQYLLTVQWKQPGDMVMWDNRQVMHRATPFSDQMEVRDMRRTTVFDDGPEKMGVKPF